MRYNSPYNAYQLIAFRGRSDLQESTGYPAVVLVARPAVHRQSPNACCLGIGSGGFATTIHGRVAGAPAS